MCPSDRRFALVLILCIATCLCMAVGADTCSAGLQGSCLSPPSAILETISADDLESAADSEAEMMSLELLQTVQVHKHAPTASAESSPHEEAEASKVDSVEKAIQTKADIQPELLQHAPFAGLEFAAPLQAKAGSSPKAASESSLVAAGSHVTATPTGAPPESSLSVVVAALAATARAQLKLDAGVQSPSAGLAQVSIILVILAAVIAQAIAQTDKFGKRRKLPRWTLPGAAFDRAIRSCVSQLKISSSSDLEAVSPPGSSSSSFLKPLASGGPMRVEVRIEGLLDRRTIVSPLAQQNCVMFSAAAMFDGELTPSAYSSKHADFIVSMADAPWVKIVVESSDMLCFGMKGGLWQRTHKTLEKAPDHLKEFVVSNMAASPSEREVLKELATQTDGQALQTTGQAIEFEEIALVVGSAVTLVGKLCRGPGGQLSLQRWQEDSSPKEACLTPSDEQHSISPSKDTWMGKILACDDPAYLSRRM